MASLASFSSMPSDLSIEACAACRAFAKKAIASRRCPTQPQEVHGTATNQVDKKTSKNTAMGRGGGMHKMGRYAYSLVDAVAANKTFLMWMKLKGACRAPRA